MYTAYLPKIYKAIQLAFFCGLFFFFSCQSKVADFHPQYFEKFQKRLDGTFKTEDRAATLDSLERAMHQFPAGPGDWVKYYRSRMAYHLDRHDYQNVFLFLDSVDQIAKKRLDEPEFLIMYSAGLTVRSNCYMDMKNYDASLNYLLEARKVWNSPDPCNASFYAERMANLFYQLHRFRVAARYFHEALNHLPHCEKAPYAKFVDKQGNLDNISLCYIGAGMYDSAAYYCQYALDYINQNEPLYPENAAFIQLARAVVNSNYAKVKHKNKLYDEAEKLNKQSIAVTDGVYYEHTMNVRLELADLYLEWNKLDRAEQMLKKLDSLHHFQARGNMEEQRMLWNLGMQKLWAKKGDTAKAFDYNTRYLTLRDSLDLIEKNNINRDLGRELENKEQRAENLMLEKKNEQQSFQLIIALLLSVMAIGVIVFTWYHLRRSSRHVKTLEKLNKEISVKKDDLTKAFTALEESQAENTRITRMVAHDLKNPIGGIRNLVLSMLKKDQVDDNKEMLALIKTSCDNSIVLINDLVKEGKSSDKNRRESVDIQRVVQYCVNLLQTKADEKSQRLYLQSAPVLISGNREKMWRVVSNILNNAIKFSPENTVINVTLQKTAGKVLLSVQDYGIGIPEALKDKIFTLQPEASRTGTAGEESHGLGLSISMKIVEEHNGRLWFESKEGEGCTFFVELPGNS